MKKQAYILVSLLLVLFLLVACGETAQDRPAPDLTGKWVQVGKEDTSFYQIAYISGDTIECWWHVVYDDDERLYWSGSFTPPENGKQPYSWTSENDSERARTSEWALRDETKTFTYQKDRLTYIVSMGNMRMTVALEKEE